MSLNAPLFLLTGVPISGGAAIGEKGLKVLGSIAFVALMAVAVSILATLPEYHP